jgi:pimeloyl-ACP methyl ester carboxylesterase
MTPRTYVSGEAASLTPLDGRHFRSMYLPPNGASNAAFLETLRALLVHETRNARGAPHGLELAFATPRPWLRPGKRIAVTRAATSFGPLSYSLERRPDGIHATVEVPARRPATLKLRLRLPRGTAIAGVTLGGRPFARVTGETIDLSGLRGKLELVARTRGGQIRRTAGTRTTLAATKRVVIRYRAHDGRRNRAVVLLPSWYGPRNNPPIPLIISPHGRGLSGRINAANWGNLPARGGFAVVNPDARGRRLSAHSWGFPRHVDDLARLPQILRRTLPWLRFDPERIYAFGGSMGGQETLLLVARHPRLLAGAAAFDAVADFALQYRNFRRLSCGKACLRAWGMPIGDGLRKLARKEIGGTPKTAPRAYARRSPLAYAEAIASSCVPLQLWWSVSDRVVVDQSRQSARLFWELRRLNRGAPVEAFVGFWIHSSEMQARTRLPLALATFGLLPEIVSLDGLRWVPQASSAPCADSR